jgi:hypothetical protein
MQKETAMQTLCCLACQKQYPVKTEAVAFMQRRHPGTIEPAEGIYRYSGGCFFKTLARSRRENNGGE